MALKLYRRHRQSCLRRYPKENRIYPPQTKTDRAKDCDCTIHVEGSLPGGDYLTNKATGANDWKLAQDIANKWTVWDATTPPVKIEPDDPTIEYVVKSFMSSIGPDGNNVEPSTIHKFGILLDHRMKSFIQQKGYTRIRQLDSMDVVTKLTESFRNLNPHHNKKGLADVKVPLATSTRRAEIERLRYFLRYCVDRGWMSKNHAEKIKASTSTTKKFGFAPEEEKRIWTALSEVDDGRGRTGQYNAIELGVFCRVMRFTGLRISDATMLHEKQIVKRHGGDGWAIEALQIKTNEWVRVPVPNSLVEQLRALTIKGKCDGKSYWFWTSEGELKTATTNWRDRVTRLLKLAQRAGKFDHSTSPHTFRHTFAISHLNAGVDIKVVSRWLGHRSITTTERHYSHAIRETHVTAERLYDESLKRQGIA
jgi:integrase